MYTPAHTNTPTHTDTLAGMHFCCWLDACPSPADGNHVQKSQLENFCQCFTLVFHDFSTSESTVDLFIL